MVSSLSKCSGRMAKLDWNLRERRSVEITDGEPYLDEVKDLIREYTDWFGRDLGFQGLDDELGNLPGKYLPPHGRLIVAIDDDGTVVGCVAYHKLDESTAEMKRLHVLPRARGYRLGEQLASQIMEIAREDGYSRMVLDTVRPLEAAVSLYRKLGFAEIEPYYHNPFDDVIYLGRDL